MPSLSQKAFVISIVIVLDLDASCSRVVCVCVCTRFGDQKSRVCQPNSGAEKFAQRKNTRQAIMAKVRPACQPLPSQQRDTSAKAQSQQQQSCASEFKLVSEKNARTQQCKAAETDGSAMQVRKTTVPTATSISYAAALPKARPKPELPPLVLTMLQECEHGIVLSCTPDHDWSLLTRKSCIYYGVKYARDAFAALVGSQKAQGARTTATLILDGYEPYHIRDWCLQCELTTQQLRELNVSVFFTGPDLYDDLVRQKTRLFIRRTASRRSTRIARKVVKL